MRSGSGSSPSSPRRPGSRNGRRRSRAATSSRRCASGSRPGALVDARAIEAATDRFLASPHAIALLPGRGGEAYRRADGRLLPIERDELVYSTPELLALEQRLIRQVAASQNTGAGVSGEKAVRAAIAARPTLSAEQQRMVERLCLGGDGVSVVMGKAGTGKTFALGAAREAWQAAGLPGARRGGRPARRPRARTRRGDQEHERRRPARRPPHRPLPERCVLVVDEAGMVPTRQLAQLIDADRGSSAASWCSSAITASCPSSKPAARSAASSTADSRSS